MDFRISSCLFDFWISSRIAFFSFCCDCPGTISPKGELEGSIILWQNWVSKPKYLGLILTQWEINPQLQSNYEKTTLNPCASLLVSHPSGVTKGDGNREVWKWLMKIMGKNVISRNDCRHRICTVQWWPIQNHHNPFFIQNANFHKGVARGESTATP